MHCLFMLAINEKMKYNYLLYMSSTVKILASTTELGLSLKIHNALVYIQKFKI